MTTDARLEPSADGPSRKNSYTLRTLPGGVVRAVRNGPALLRAHRAGRVSDQLAEKIMLATTAVNECRYCTRFHTVRARQVDVDSEVIDAILRRDVGVVEAEERPALVFAERYAEAAAAPDESAVEALEAAYGPEMAGDVQAYVRAIYFGNLLGNSVDAFRHWLWTAVDGCVARVRQAVPRD